MPIWENDFPVQACQGRHFKSPSIHLYPLLLQALYITVCNANTSNLFTGYKGSSHTLLRIPSFLLVLPDGTHQESASIWEDPSFKGFGFQGSGFEGLGLGVEGFRGLGFRV